MRRPDPDPQLARSRSASAIDLAALECLAYELLDAHEDTRLLATEPMDELGWRTHLDYLRALQRVGREVLARTHPIPPADC